MLRKQPRGEIVDTSLLLGVLSNAISDSQFFGGMPSSSGATMNGLALIVLIYGTASISGGHLNPAVSAGLAVTQQISPIKMGLYWVAQIAGTIVGAAWIYALNGDRETDSKIFSNPTTNCGPGFANGDYKNNGGDYAITGCNSCTLPSAELNGGQVFGIEFLATFTLVFTVFACAVDPRGAAGNAAPFAIGASLWATASGIGSLTGGSLNPSRTLGPAIVFNCWKTNTWLQPGQPPRYYISDPQRDTYQWAYVLGQLLAGVSAGLIYKFVFLTRPDDGAPGPATVFQFVARDGMAVKRDLQSAKAIDTEAPAADNTPKDVLV